MENTSHHSRDVTLGEDRSRIRTNPGVFARLRSFAFNILKANRTDTLSQDRYRAGLVGIKDLLRSNYTPPCAEAASLVQCADAAGRAGAAEQGRAD